MKKSLSLRANQAGSIVPFAMADAERKEGGFLRAFPFAILLYFSTIPHETVAERRHPCAATEESDKGPFFVKPFPLRSFLRPNGSGYREPFPVL